MKIIIQLFAAIVLASAARVAAQENVAPPPSPAESPPLSPEASFFYDQLAPHGQWFWLEPYGWVWTPNDVDTAWRPYTDGHWVYTDCGWTWVSEREWGWAPFHYGRWFFHDHRGWCWVPGQDWAPAWVSWRWGDNGCGWAPMPPLVAWETVSDWDTVIPTFAWCFVSPAHFHELHLREHLVLAAQNVTFLRTTRNVTRFEVRDRRLVNLSITAEQLEKVIGRPVHRFKITDINSPNAARLSISGRNEIHLYRPVVKETKVLSPIRREVIVNPARPAVTFDQLRRDEAAHRQFQAQQAQERQALERVHQSELRTTPRGLSAQELRERQQAEHRAFNEHVNRQNQIFENRRPAPPPPAPPAPSSRRSGRDTPNGR